MEEMQSLFKVYSVQMFTKDPYGKFPSSTYTVCYTTIALIDDSGDFFFNFVHWKHLEGWILYMYFLKEMIVFNRHMRWRLKQYCCCRGTIL